MRLLVITPSLGQSAWLDETVASVAEIKCSHQHVLVVPAINVVSLSARFPHAKVVAEPGGGMYAAINAGLAAADKWEAFTYINDDDLLLANFSSVIGAIKATGSSGPLIAYGRVRLVGENGRRLGAISVSPDPALNRQLYAQRIEPVYQHGTVATRATVDAIGGFDATLRYCGDSEFLARACVQGVPFVRVPGGEVAAFRLRTGQLTKNRVAMEAERERVDQKLQLLVPQLTAEHRRARWQFRLANTRVYAERVMRHGFVSFDELLGRAE